MQQKYTRNVMPQKLDPVCQAVATGSVHEGDLGSLRQIYNP